VCRLKDTCEPDAGTCYRGFEVFPDSVSIRLGDAFATAFWNFTAVMTLGLDSGINLQSADE
jgi:hypothetical protein